jgi:hypothetical protein
MTPLDRDRLAKVLAMLASPHPDEAAAAAKTALNLLNAADMTWNEVLDTRIADQRAQAKISALKASNNRLRSENHALRAKVKQIGPPHLANMQPPQIRRAMSIWILIVFAFGAVAIYFLQLSYGDDTDYRLERASITTRTTTAQASAERVVIIRTDRLQLAVAVFRRG